jgi:hypothetical protein
MPGVAPASTGIRPHFRHVGNRSVMASGDSSAGPSFRGLIVWSVELASMVFLWLAMLGSVLALQRGRATVLARDLT